MSCGAGAEEGGDAEEEGPAGEGVAAACGAGGDAAGVDEGEGGAGAEGAGGASSPVLSGGGCCGMARVVIGSGELKTGAGSLCRGVGLGGSAAAFVFCVPAVEARPGAGFAETAGAGLP